MHKTNFDYTVIRTKYGKLRIEIIVITFLLVSSGGFSPGGNFNGKEYSKMNPIIVVEDNSFTFIGKKTVSELVGNNEMYSYIEDNLGRHVFEDTFNANSNITLYGEGMYNVNFTATFNYGKYELTKKGFIDNWNSHTKLQLSFNNLPYEYNTTLDTGDVKIKWDLKGSERVFKRESNLKIDLKTKPTGAQESDFRLSDPRTIGPRLSSHPDKWDITSTNIPLIQYDKGEGIELRTVIHFNLAATCIGLNWKIESLNHNGFSTYVGGVYVYGSFSAGSNWGFTFPLGWNFLGGKYALGQGTYVLKRASAYGCGGQTEFYKSGGDESLDVVNIDPQDGTDNVVFSFYVSDSSVTGRTPSNVADDAKGKFENTFNLKFYFFYYQYDWTAWLTIISDQYTLRNDDELFEGIKDAFNTKTGRIWDTNWETDSDHRGYDILYGLSEVRRISEFQVIGAAKVLIINGIRKGGNIAWGVLGKGSSFLYHVNRMDNIMQHEYSHLFGPEHNDNNNNIMDSTLPATFYMYDSWINWISADEVKIADREDNFTNNP